MLRKGVEKKMTADPFAVGTLHFMEMPHPSEGHPKGPCFSALLLQFHHIGTKFWIIPVKVKIGCDYLGHRQLYN